MKPENKKVNKVLLVILDGFGISHKKSGNAVTNACMPFYQSLIKKFPHTHLHAAEKFVGLPDGYIGNSEVGHLHIGAGRRVTQDLTRIFDAIKNKSFFNNKTLLQSIKHVKRSDGTLHLLVLLSDAGVHSHIEHLFAALKLAKLKGVRHAAVHAILDGRDVAPKSACKYIKKTKIFLSSLNNSWRIATIIGRFYAMDRDKRWHRTKKAYDILTSGIPTHKDAAGTVEKYYAKRITDEFIPPTRLTHEMIKDGDSVFFINYRADRARQLTHAFVDKNFTHFKRRKLNNLFFATMTEYEHDLPVGVVFPQKKIKNSLGEVVAKAGLKQFRLAETEKWAHVTFFFNGLTDKIFKGEHRLLIPSPKVRTYDKTPQMSAAKITNSAITALSKDFALIVINYANPDMIGHTGKYGVTIKANEYIDACIARLVPEAQKKGYSVIITGDHGNAEEMKHANGQPCTSHTRNDVPFVLVSSKQCRIKNVKNAALYHIAPTILDMMNIRKPTEIEQGLLDIL
ncbi:MAG: 2,3-bisphosphoglycerate-independent phosphoglycerate mutase [Candidatus Aenigmarchaeota archaeon]|nr:2,3-bisphosphoglycerate-independent phosphoglycerate mutase [Candidatus Aenigmarchaeota archaeon]